MKVQVVGLNFRRQKRGTRYDAGDLSLRLGDYCVVNTKHGMEVARVAINPMILPRKRIKGNLPKVLRQATEEDIGRFRELEAEEVRARRTALKWIRDMGLPMKIFQV